MLSKAQNFNLYQKPIDQFLAVKIQKITVQGNKTSNEDCKGSMLHIRRVKNRSMEPTLTNNVLILTKTFRFPYRGQIVTFRNPINFAETIIKRVIAIKRDQLKISEGSIYLNGESLKEPYIEGLPKTMDIEEEFDWNLENDFVIVLSDNRLSGNLDSRILGPIKCAHILEELVIKLWPIKFRNP